MPPRPRTILLVSLLLAVVALWFLWPRQNAPAKTALASSTPEIKRKIEVMPESREPPSVKPKASASDAPPMRPLAEWRNVGNQTPGAAFESLFWAKEQGDTVALAALMSFAPEVRKRAQEVFDAMSLVARSRLSISTPQELVAFLYANSPAIGGFRIRKESQTQPSNAIVTGDLQDADGRVISNEFQFKMEPGGWHYVLDEPNAIHLLDHWQEYLGLGRSPKKPVRRQDDKPAQR